MSQEAERVKRIVDFKERLEKKIEKLELQLKDHNALLETVNELLLEKGFRRPELPKQQNTQVLSSRETEHLEPEARLQSEENVTGNVTDLMSADGVLLAKLYCEGRFARVVPASSMCFNVNVSPFSQFLVERVLAKMQERDSELVRMGKLQAADIFSYSIVRDGEVVQEITLKNFDEERLKELTSSVRWTLEKMYEKTKCESLPKNS